MGKCIMAEKTEIEKLNILRKNNAESNAITKECIESALILMMKEKPFSEISILEITKRAGVGRSSYYRNYDSKEAILEGHLDSIFAETTLALQKFDPISQCKESWITLLTITKTHAADYKLLFEAGFGDKILNRFLSSFNNDPDRCAVTDITNTYISGCIYAVVKYWINDNMKTDISTVAEVCSNLMTSGMRL